MISAVEALGTTDPLAHELDAIAWRDFLVFAIGQDDIREQFEQDTGKRFLPLARTPMDAMVDAAVSKELMDAFVLWATENLWGHMPLLAKRPE